VFRRYLVRLVFRVAVFAGVFYLYVFRRELLDGIGDFRPFADFTPLHALWLIFMANMLGQMIPHRGQGGMSGGKQFARAYVPPGEPYDREELREHILRLNASARGVLLVWLAFGGVIGLLHMSGVVGNGELLLLTMGFYIGDLVCVLFFCPFQTFFMKSRCCVSCRIFNWGNFMMFTPMLFVRSFFSWSLVFTALVSTALWEIAVLMHPERFWEGSNAALRCKNCRDPICRIKHPPKTEKSPLRGRPVCLPEQRPGREA